MEWKEVLYNGIETNIEVTRCGRVKKIPKDWYGKSSGSSNILYGEVDFSKLKLHSKGYVIIGIQIKQNKPRSVLVQQLIAAAFLGYNFGNFPNEVVMHLDDNPLNNNLSNLKVGTQRENCSQTQTIKSGLPVGVYFNKQRKKYKSAIYINGKKIYLGYYDDIESASQAYQNKLKSLN